MDLTSDFTGDGSVDFSDFLLFASKFGLKSGEDGFDPVFDLSANGEIDFADVLTFANQFGQ